MSTQTASGSHKFHREIFIIGDGGNIQYSRLPFGGVKRYVTRSTIWDFGEDAVLLVAHQTEFTYHHTIFIEDAGFKKGLIIRVTRIINRLENRFIIKLQLIFIVGFKSFSLHDGAVSTGTRIINFQGILVKRFNIAHEFIDDIGWNRRSHEGITARNILRNIRIGRVGDGSALRGSGWIPNIVEKVFDIVFSSHRFSLLETAIGTHFHRGLGGFFHVLMFFLHFLLSQL